MVDLIKLILNFLYAQSTRNDIDEESIIRTESWLVKNRNDRVVDYEALPNGEYVLKKLILVLINCINYASTPWYIRAIT